VTETVEALAGGWAIACGRMYRLRMPTAPMQLTLWPMPAGIQIARVLGTTQRPAPACTTSTPDSA